MNRNTRQRCVYPSLKQKKKLLEFMTKHPELALGKVTQNFSNNDAQRLWTSISKECNALPGSRKTWRQWRKTWQDIKSKTKKKQENGLKQSIFNLTDAEHVAIGMKLELTQSEEQKGTEFVSSGVLDIGSVTGSFTMEDQIDMTNEEVESQTEECDDKTFTKINKGNMRSNQKVSDDDYKHSSTCIFSCKQLAKLEQRKIDMKEDYINFRKDYLTQKLKLMKEQTEALQRIGIDLTNTL